MFDLSALRLRQSLTNVFLQILYNVSFRTVSSYYSHFEHFSPQRVKLTVEYKYNNPRKYSYLFSMP